MVKGRDMENDEWKLIETVEPGSRVIVFDPKAEPYVFEAMAWPDGGYQDPVYDEWYSNKSKATHWRPMPAPPKW